MPDYVFKAIGKGDIKTVLKWINVNRTEDRANATASFENGIGIPALSIASLGSQLKLMTLLLQLGANVDSRGIQGSTAMSFMFSIAEIANEDANEMVRLLLSWGATFFPDGRSREYCISQARKYGADKLANLLGCELGGRRCEIVNPSSRPELNGKTCVADEYIPDSNQYKVTLETKSKEVLFLDPDNLKRRDRTPQDCGYYIEFKNGRTIRHDFDSSEDCQAFVLSMNKGETKPVVSEEAEARAEQAAAELLAELGLDDSPNGVATRGNQVKRPKKKKGSKKKKKK